MDDSIQRHRFTVDEYERLYEVGLIPEEERVELVDGELLTLPEVSGRHVRTTVRLNRVFADLGDQSLELSPRNPLRLDGWSSLLPDLVVARYTFSNEHLDLRDVFMVIEVVDSSLAYDRTVKFPRYAGAGIPEAWLINLADGRIERHSDPRAGGYRQMVWAQRGEQLASTVLPALVLDVAMILGVGESE